MAVKGIDISYANKGLDYARLKADGVSFAIIRTGYRDQTDAMFETHIKGAKAAGINVGAYCYCMAKTPAEARKEAQHAISVVKPYKLSYPLFCDMEDSSLFDLSKTKLTNIALAFLETVEAAGYRAGLYANPSWLENKLNRDRILSRYDLWLAHWTEDPDVPSRYQYGQKMWQWGAEELNGSNGRIDGDICFVDYPAIIGDEDDCQCGGYIPSKGDTVLFGGGSHYGASSSAKPTGSLRTAGTAKVTNIAQGTAHPYHLVGESSNVYGWVDKDTVFALSSGETGKAKAELNFRETAGLDGKILTVIPANSTVVLFKETEAKDGYVWQKAAYNGLVGYVASEYIAI
ncbi:MAG: SH3 domain-containing protein [Oscillospiraceae bacterium]|nr:SH3 domain-containing protein [Oscillospiraceae bacterium]